MKKIGGGGVGSVAPSHSDQNQLMETVRTISACCWHETLNKQGGTFVGGHLPRLPRPSPGPVWSLDIQAQLEI